MCLEGMCVREGKQYRGWYCGTGVKSQFAMPAFHIGVLAVYFKASFW